MGHVGHKITAHGFGLLQCGHIPGNQKLAPLPIRIQVHRQTHRARRCAAAPGHQNFMVIVAAGVISRKTRVAHQVANGLHHVALRIKAKLLSCRLVAPLDAPLRVQQHHTIRRGLQSRQKLLQACLAVLQLHFAPAQQAAGAVHNFAVHPTHRGRTGRITPAQPAQHPQCAQQINKKPAPAGGHAASQSTPCTRPPPAEQSTGQLKNSKYQEAPEHAGRITRSICPGRAIQACTSACAVKR